MVTNRSNMHGKCSAEGLMCGTVLTQVSGIVSF